MISLILVREGSAKMHLAGLAERNVRARQVHCPLAFQTIQALNGIIGSRLQAGDQGNRDTRVKGRRF